MTARSVYWQDGMFMWPHHMQQEERFEGERIRLTHRWNVHHNWGLRALDLDADALKSGSLVVRRLQARMRDGTLIEVPGEGRLPSLDLNALLLAKNEVTIYLALPNLHANRPNVTEPRGPGDVLPAGAPAPVETRYRAEEFEVPDENTGQDAQMLPFRVLNVKLLPDTQDVAGYEVLPIGRFIKNAGGENAPRLDVTFIPPVLACDAWKPLGVDILQGLFHHFNARSESLAGRATTRGITFETHNPGDELLLGHLAVVNEASSVLNTIAFAEGIHPFPAYLELCRLVGQLSIFSGDRKVPRLPPYDHDDLSNCFYRVKRLLDETEPPGEKFDERPFVGESMRMQVAMEPKWLEAAWQMFVGVQSSLTEPEVVKLLTRPGHLDMKIGSGERVDQIFERGLKGLEFTHAAQPPRVLPTKPGLTYFQVNRDSQKSEWEQVQQSLTLAIRVNETRLILGPEKNIQGQRSLSLKQQGAQAATDMQLSLFLVPGDATAS